jgi:ABC-2 type transport system ATP-binding protein
LQELPGVLAVQIAEDAQEGERGHLAIEFSGDDAALSQVLAALISHGIPVVRFSEDTRDLEEVFMRATKGLVT